MINYRKHYLSLVVAGKNEFRGLYLITNRGLINENIFV